MLAGCPAAIANLWDITDRDIDRFSEAVLSKWMCQRSNDAGSQSLTNPAACMSAAVTASSQACRLVSLIGAAPVCYGIPVSIACL